MIVDSLLNFFMMKCINNLKYFWKFFQGFASNCKKRKGQKVWTIGGLLGSVAYIIQLLMISKKNLIAVGPQEIIICTNIDKQSISNTRISGNKTIVGSLKYHTIFDCQFRINDAYGTANDNPSDNIVFKDIWIPLP